MFSRKCVCKLNISKIVRPLLAALSVNGIVRLGFYLSARVRRREIASVYGCDDLNRARASLFSHGTQANRRTSFAIDQTLTH